ncbi:hypothetical protein ESA94_10740 [Lacibacter luteus]|uniref:YtxH domain-containing protein n=1 Tax=Lacibacter luteus TaxID=2508719 RepID=A0A4Q1CKL8_9BACT|nr:hypothetical protein [Lacibacter luteus]RXK60924.1 hypothetical protein ESA94_10740 [Lacibacter luteus]
MKTFLKKSVWYLPGAAIGAIGGYFYWKYFGCNGTCLITSSPVRSIVYFAVMGTIVNSMFQPNGKKTTEEHS